ncbi:MAG: hypothetical protein GX299_01540 [Epulopiscium sp.]|nr:hypothetical protein [Candidatus Epulonipiscium sp.]
MANNDIYELAKLLNNSEGIHQDFSQVIGALQEGFQKKYVKKIHATAEAQKDAVVERPPKEVTLLRAMRAFADDSKKQQYDRAIQMLLMLNTIKNVNENINALAQAKPQLLQTRSSDGKNQVTTEEPPEISEQSARMAGLLVTLAVANIL